MDHLHVPLAHPASMEKTLLLLKNLWPVLTALPKHFPVLQARQCSSASAIKDLQVRMVLLAQRVKMESTNQPMDRMSVRSAAKANSDTSLAQCLKACASRALQTPTLRRAPRMQVLVTATGASQGRIGLKFVQNVFLEHTSLS